MLPAPGSPADQTQFAKEVFDFLDNLVSQYRKQIHKSMEAKNKKK